MALIDAQLIIFSLLWTVARNDRAQNYTCETSGFLCMCRKKEKNIFKTD